MSAKRSPAVTLKSIAAEMGVSVTTVARALKDGDRISPEMVDRVRATATRMGYVRNLEGARLRTGKTFVIMAFLGLSPEEEVGDSGSVGLLNGIHARLASTDYAVRAVPVSAAEQSLDRVRDVVQGRLADGIVLDHIGLQDERVKYLLEADFPFVTFGRTELLSAHSWFDIDNEHAAWQGTDALLRDGHRRIALIDGDMGQTFVRQRLRGYERALSEHGLSPDPALRFHAEPSAEAARGIAADLAGENRADAFLCVNEMVLLGARAGVRARIGAGIDGIGFAMRAGTNLASYVGGRIHASHFSRRQSGWELADLLLRQIGGADRASCQKLVRTDLVTT
ncbi:LacI family transcriptional regulator [Paracoccus aurantiacus]|uniref:LacI family transcriptional regulator n=1 Tax=Paracoccus aurantiacus TaxID=2599412 RepID=A0A5C6S4N1_9RHOB|nr:LacI family DNA-binding transcriptional regulator [Paracoccus aurantiacus]TXB69580.1 LacI family transcriptional regulator [Paracoccus aurantiacus]